MSRQLAGLPLHTCGALTLAIVRVRQLVVAKVLTKVCQGPVGAVCYRGVVEGDVMLWRGVAWHVRLVL